MKPSRKKLTKLIREEKSSSRSYRKMGFKTLSNDEKRHAKFLSNVRKQTTI